MIIRPAVPNDLTAILELERATPTAAHWSDAEYALLFDSGAASRLALVALNPGVTGFIIARTISPEWEIENVVISPEHRGRGFGLALVTAVCDAARSACAESLSLEVRASNAAARALYRRAGFTEVGIRPRYYGDPEENAVLYRWSSNEPAEAEIPN